MSIIKHTPEKLKITLRDIKVSRVLFKKEQRILRYLNLLTPHCKSCHFSPFMLQNQKDFAYSVYANLFNDLTWYEPSLPSIKQMEHFENVFHKDINPKTAKYLYNNMQTLTTVNYCSNARVSRYALSDVDFNNYDKKDIKSLKQAYRYCRILSLNEVIISEELSLEELKQEVKDAFSKLRIHYKVPSYHRNYSKSKYDDIIDWDFFNLSKPNKKHKSKQRGYKL